ncbi:MAG: hypothetical protein EZS28_009167 [Streblomastix strix]|uniref:Uncharacterized protein n=1 Tax=Streblomastix strix TaxID=222440 RepID=A0A5J4WJT9_9EUKA|nr:MAG: hypothetical protein EZS28_009167 [Streblomastix strix]
MQKEPTTMLQSASHQSLQQLKDDDSSVNMQDEEEYEDVNKAKPKRASEDKMEEEEDMENCRVYSKSYVEFGDEYADLVQAAVLIQEAALTTMLAIISKEPAFESAKQMYINVTITATYAQKMRDIRNTFGKGKAIAAGKQSKQDETITSKD